jgi:hypothetical protein
VGQSLSNQNFACSGGDFVLIRGTVTTVHPNKVLSSASISDAGGVCTVDADGLGYECRTSTLQTEYWTGTITFNASGGVICNTYVAADNPITLSFSNIEHGVYTIDLDIQNNSNSCTMHMGM